jgi:hypothetical protein
MLKHFGFLSKTYFLFYFALNYRCTNSFHAVATHVGIDINIDIDIDIDIAFYFSQITGKFYFLHVKNARNFFPEMESILLGNGSVIVNDCTNRGACQCNPTSALVNFTK